MPRKMNVICHWQLHSFCYKQVGYKPSSHQSTRCLRKWITEVWSLAAYGEFSFQSVQDTNTSYGNLVKLIPFSQTATCQMPDEGNSSQPVTGRIGACSLCASLAFFVTISCQWLPSMAGSMGTFAVNATSHLKMQMHSSIEAIVKYEQEPQLLLR